MPTSSEIQPLYLLALTSALASGLSDEQSDRAGGKRTFVTTFGNRAVRWLAELCLGLGAAAWIVIALAFPRILVWWAALPGAAVVLWHGWQARRVSGQAVTNAFAAQGGYKLELHRAIWRGHLVLAVLLVVAAWTR